MNIGMSIASFVKNEEFPTKAKTSTNAIALTCAIKDVIGMVSTVIGRMMDKEKKYIGTLTALGYRNREISFHYSIYGLIPGLIGGVLGILRLHFKICVNLQSSV